MTETGLTEEHVARDERKKMLNDGLRSAMYELMNTKAGIVKMYLKDDNNPKLLKLINLIIKAINYIERMLSL